MTIGIFDSGSGGLTVLQACRRRLPRQDYIYLGDHARAPYGSRSAEDVYRFTLQMVERLFDEGCRLVLLACNTASAVALRRLQQTWLPVHAPDRRVLGVLVPMIEEMTGAAWAMPPMRGESGKLAPARTIAVFATPATIASQAYRHEVALRAPHLTVIEQACPGLVDAIEAGADTAALAQHVNAHVAELMATLAPGRRIDAVVLGCTHYPLLEAQFRDALPAGVPLYCQPSIVAASLARYLDRHRRFAGGTGGLRLLTTAAHRPADLGATLGLAPAYCAFERLAA